MNKDHPQIDNDISSEEYKGPSVASAAAGEGYIAHFIAGIVGAFAGGAVAYLFHKPVSKFINNWKQAGMAWSESSNLLVKGPGMFSKWLVGYTEGTFNTAKAAMKSSVRDPKIAHELEKIIEAKEGGFIHGVSRHVFGHIPFLKEKFVGKTSARADAVAMGGGLLGAIGFLFYPAIAAPEGAKKGIDGRNQFDRLKARVVRLEADLVDQEERYDALRSQYIDTKVQLENARTNHRDTEQDQQSDKLTIGDSGNGKIDDPVIEEPKIKTPKIGPQPHLMDAENDNAASPHAEAHAAREPIKPTDGADWQDKVVAQKSALHEAAINA